MASFAPIPDVPMDGLNLAESGLFKALKENAEILAGVRVQGVRAVTSDTITIQPANNQSSPRVTAGAQGYATSYPNSASVTYPLVIISATDYANLVTDVQNVMNDLAKVQNVVNSLIAQLRS